MLDGLLPFVLLSLSVDLFGLFGSSLLHLALPFSETGLNAGLPLKLSLLVEVHALWGRKTCEVCIIFVSSRQQRGLCTKTVVDSSSQSHDIRDIDSCFSKVTQSCNISDTGFSNTARLLIICCCRVLKYNTTSTFSKHNFQLTQRIFKTALLPKQKQSKDSYKRN